MRKEFTSQSQHYYQHQLLDQQTTVASVSTVPSPMKPKKRQSDNKKNPKKRRSSSTSDKENEQQQQQHQLSVTPEANGRQTTGTTAQTNGYTNGQQQQQQQQDTAPTLTNGHRTDLSSSSPSSSSSSSASSTTASTSSSATAVVTPAVTKVYEPHSMDWELDAAVQLMTRLVSKTPAGKQNMHKMSQFNAQLVKALREYYSGHWYPERPMRGSGHRCLRVNQSGSTSIIEKTAMTSENRWVLDSLPKEFTLWIDPGEVSYRIGEDGSICVHFNQPIKRPVSTKQG